MYITPAQLLERFGPVETAQVATADDRAVVDSELLRLTISGGDRDAFDADAVADADEALERIQAATADAAALIDGYLRSRYTLPLDPVPLPLRRIAGDVVRYYLMDDRASEEVRERYAAQLKVLADIRDGRVTLGADDPAPAQVGSPAVSTPTARVMTPGRLQGYAG